MSTSYTDVEDQVQEEIEDSLDVGGSSRSERITKQQYIAALLNISKPDKNALKLNVQDRSEQGYWNALLKVIEKDNPDTTIDAKQIAERKAQLLIARKNAFVQFVITYAYYDPNLVTQITGHQFQETEFNGQSYVRGLTIEKHFPYTPKNKSLWNQLSKARRLVYSDVPNTKKAGSSGRQAKSIVDPEMVDL